MEEKKVPTAAAEGAIRVFDPLWLKMCLKCTTTPDGFGQRVLHSKPEDKGKTDYRFLKNLTENNAHIKLINSPFKLIIARLICSCLEVLFQPPFIKSNSQSLAGILLHSHHLCQIEIQ